MVGHGSYLDGRSALNALDGRIGQVRSSLSRALDEVENAEARQAEVRQHQAEAYSALADIRLDILSSEATLKELEGAERRARELLDRHETYAEEKQAKVQASARTLEELEVQRRLSAEELDARIEAYETKVEEIEAELETDSAYLALAEAHEKAEAITARSEQKLQLAREDRKQKGAPYDNDPLFSYLWKRGFRTTDYKGRGITKMLDGWVARLCRFDRARLNYARLTELPERLAEHVERVKKDEAKALERLEAAEQNALEAGGAFALEQAANDQRGVLAELDKNIEEAEARHLVKVNEHEAVLSGGQGPAAEARKILEAALRQASFPDLRLLAAETIELEDDRIVDELVKLRAEQMSIELDEAELQRRPSHLKQDLKALETLRRRFKSARLDSPYASFKTSSLERALSGISNGSLDVDRALRTLRKGMRQIQPRTPRGFGGQRRDDTLGLPDVMGDILVEVLKQGSRGGWSSGRARPIKRRSPSIKIGSGSKKSGGRKGGGFKTTGGF